MRGAVPGEVGRTGAGDLLQPGERPADHLAVGEMAAANDAVDSLANQIDVTLAFADLQRNVRVAGEKLWQRGQQQGPRRCPPRLPEWCRRCSPGAAVGLPQGPPEWTRSADNTASLLPSAVRAGSYDVAAAPRD